MCKESTACYITTRNYVEQQLTVSRLFQVLFDPGSHGRIVCFLEQGLVSREGCLHNKPRQTFGRACASVQGHAVLFSALSCQPGTLLHILHLRHADHLPAELELKLTDAECSMKHLDSSFSHLELGMPSQTQSPTQKHAPHLELLQTQDQSV